MVSGSYTHELLSISCGHEPKEEKHHNIDNHVRQRQSAEFPKVLISKEPHVGNMRIKMNNVREVVKWRFYSHKEKRI